MLCLVHRLSRLVALLDVGFGPRGRRNGGVQRARRGQQQDPGALPQGGFWEARQGLALVLNVQDVEVDLSRGDIVAYADSEARGEPDVRRSKPRPPEQSSTATVSVAEGPRSGGVPACTATEPNWCHILLDEPQLDHLFEVEIPPEAYYQAFRKSLGVKRPDADPFLLDHI